MEPYRFSWAGSGMGHVWFIASHPTLEQGRQEIEYVHESHLDPYHRRIFNGSEAEWQREIVQMVNVLRFAHYAYRMRLAPELVDAFNTWRQAEHQALLRRLRADPERYGPVSDNDPLLKPPPIVRGANWIDGRWVFLEDLPKAA